jgi:hypothetical protein
MALGAHKDSAIGCILIHFALNEANDAINIMNSVSSTRPVSADRCEEDLMFRVVCGVAAVVVWGAAAVAVGHAQPPKTPRIVTDRVTNYKVRQVVKLDDIKPGSKSIRMWVAIPDDEENQSVLDLDVVSAARQMDHCQRSRKPGKVSPGGHCRSQESFTGSDGGPSCASRFYLVVDPSRVTPLSPALKNAFAEHLDRNAPHMKVTPKIQKMADEVCKSETNAATQAALLIDHVMKVADHYSYTKDPLMPKCGIGDAENCLSKGAAAAPICTRCLFRSLAPAAFPPGWPWAIAFRKRTSVRWSTPVIAAGSSIF